LERRGNIRKASEEKGTAHTYLWKGVIGEKRGERGNVSMSGGKYQTETDQNLAIGLKSHDESSAVRNRKKKGGKLWEQGGGGSEGRA